MTLYAKCNSSTGEVKEAFPCVCFYFNLDKGSVATGVSKNDEAVDGCKR